MQTPFADDIDGDLDFRGRVAVDVGPDDEIAAALDEGHFAAGGATVGREVERLVALLATVGVDRAQVDLVAADAKVLDPVAGTTSGVVRRFEDEAVVSIAADQPVDAGATDQPVVAIEA